MEKNTTIVTRKIELRISDESEMKYNDLKNWSTIVDKAHNYLINELYLQDYYCKQIISKSEEVTKIDQVLNPLLEIEKIINTQIKELKDEEETNEKKELLEKKKLNEEQIKELKKKRSTLIKEERSNILFDQYSLSEQGIANRLLTSNKDFNSLPSYINAAISNTVYKLFCNDINDVSRGKKSLRNYRSGQPIPFMKTMIRHLEKNNDGRYTMTWGNFDFYLHFGEDKSNNKIIVDRCKDETYKICDSSIQLAKNKIFLNLVVEIPKEHKEIDINKVIGIDLGLNIPIAFAVKGTPVKGTIGDW